jgi:hypothetical protein
MFRRIRESISQFIFDSNIMQKWREDASNSLVRVIDERLDYFKEQQKAFMAVDHNWNDYGHVVVCMQVGNQDFVKIIQVQRKTALLEWRRMIEQIESDYGINAKFIDSPVKNMGIIK